MVTARWQCPAIRHHANSTAREMHALLLWQLQTQGQGTLSAAAELTISIQFAEGSMCCKHCSTLHNCMRHAEKLHKQSTVLPVGFAAHCLTK